MSFHLGFKETILFDFWKTESVTSKTSILIIDKT